MKDVRGITIVSLVLTIILMLILAGVTLKISSNGIINKKDKISNDYYSQEKNTTDKIKTLDEEWK